MKNKFLNLCTAVVVLFALVLSAGAAAQKNRVEIDLGVYVTSIDTSVTLHSTQLQEGTNINLEDEIGLDDNKVVPGATVIIHIGERSAIELGYFSLSRNGSRDIDTQIKFGNEIFEVNETVDVKFDVDVYRFGIRHDFFGEGKWNLGAGIGIHAMKFDIGVSALNDEAAANISKIAPLPYLSVFTQYDFTEKLHVKGLVQFLELKVGGIEGNLVSASVSVNYDFNHRFGVGAAYNLYTLGVKLDKLRDDLKGTVDYTYSGPAVYVKLGF